MARDGKVDMSVATLTAHQAYLRPEELHSLRRQEVIAPQGRSGAEASWALFLGPIEERKPTKTQVYDDSVLVIYRGTSKPSREADEYRQAAYDLFWGERSLPRICIQDAFFNPLKVYIYGKVGVHRIINSQEILLHLRRGNPTISPK